MKKLTLLFISFVCILTLNSCQKKNENQNNEISASEIKVDSITFKIETSKKVSKEGDTLFASFKVKFPKFIGGDASIIGKINGQIEQMVKDQVYSLEDSVQTQKVGTIEEIAQSFIKEYKTYNEENTDIPLGVGWEYEGSGDTLLISPKVISIYYSVYSFLGGAHGNFYTTYMNFNAQTGDLLKLTDIVSDTTALKKIAELKFEKTQKAFAKDNDFEYNKEDYFWGSPFFLPKNIAITKSGLSFLYNPYEAAAYAIGAIYFELTWQELGTLVKKEIR